MTNLVPSGITAIDARILTIRGQRVMLNVDIARLFGVSTKRLNQQVKRQQERFPPDFMFRLTKSEKAEVVTNCDHLRKLRFSATMPLAFTEHGSLMLANVLRSPTAFQVSVAIVRAFIRLREAIASHRDLATKLDVLERKYDRQFKVVFDAIRALMARPRRKARRIGFRLSA